MNKKNLKTDFKYKVSKAIENVFSDDWSIAKYDSDAWRLGVQNRSGSITKEIVFVLNPLNHVYTIEMYIYSSPMGGTPITMWLDRDKKEKYPCFRHIMHYENNIYSAREFPFPKYRPDENAFEGVLKRDITSAFWGAIKWFAEAESGLTDD